MLDLNAITAANRFGLGARPEEAAAIGANPRDWLLRQISRQVADPKRLPKSLESFPSGQEQAVIFLQAWRDRQGAGVQDLIRERWQDHFRDEAGASIEAAVLSDTPLIERLVRFWSNHFTVSAQKGAVVGLAGAFEREAIRPYVCGRFSDMLLAVMRHPAMLFYLDNAPSVGPASPMGMRNRRGLNENLAREILELHTLGVDGGYKQDDVRSLAEILTGWGVAVPPSDRDPGEPNPGMFRFRYQAHQPGDKILLKTHVKESGEDEGLAALQFLAAHPATARHIATKLTRHFISDTPPRDSIARIEDVFRTTGGDLAAMTRALIAETAAWDHVQSKIRSPQELVIAGLRNVGVASVERRAILAPLRDMEHVPWTASSPAGWPDAARHWVSPDAMLHRVEWAAAAGRKLGNLAPPRQIMAHALGHLVRPDLAMAVERAPSGAEGLGLVLASAEFQRR